MYKQCVCYPSSYTKTGQKNEEVFINTRVQVSVAQSEGEMENFCQMQTKCNLPHSAGLLAAIGPILFQTYNRHNLIFSLTFNQNIFSAASPAPFCIFLWEHA